MIAGDTDQISIQFQYQFNSLLDLSVAFDTIDHNLLLYRLKYVFVVTDVALSFFRSCLEDRERVVSVRNYESFSSPCCMVCLSLLYTQPLFDMISRQSVLHHMLADDT